MPASVWDDLVGQPRAAAFLSRATAAGSVAHAYLFVGPTGTGKKTAAFALACSLVCPHGGCGACAACRRVRAGVHPDVHVLSPEGVAGYLIEQVRDLVHDVNLSPVEARRKVYVLQDADRLRSEAANALLKTLEEPPADVVIVLLAADYDDVPPTIASRCQVVKFAPVPVSRAVAVLVEQTGAEESEARAALAAVGGAIPHAAAFLRSPGRRAARLAALGTLKRLSFMDAHDVLLAARELLADVHAPVEELKAAHAEQLDEAREFLSRGGVAELEKRQKREITAREREAVGEILNITESWLRDCLVIAKGASELVVNADAADAATEVARLLSVPAALRALEAVRTARSRIAYNVSPQLVVEAMLFDIQEVLTCPR